MHHLFHVHYVEREKKKEKPSVSIASWRTM